METFAGVLPFLVAGSSSSWIVSGRFLDALDAGAPAAFAAGVLKFSCFLELAMLPVSSFRLSDGDLGVCFAVLGLPAVALAAGVFAGGISAVWHVKRVRVRAACRARKFAGENKSFLWFET